MKNLLNKLYRFTTKGLDPYWGEGFVYLTSEHIFVCTYHLIPGRGFWRVEIPETSSAVPYTRWFIGIRKYYDGKGDHCPNGCPMYWATIQPEQLLTHSSEIVRRWIKHILVCLEGKSPDIFNWNELNR